MEIKGSVADQANGSPIVGAQIWEILPDGRSAEVVGVTGVGGKYDVEISDPGSTVNFVIDGYTATAIPATQAAGSDQVLLAKDGSLQAKLTLSGVPAWLWMLAGVAFIFLIGDKKKR
jgi:hypothetical protein